MPTNEKNVTNENTTPLEPQVEAERQRGYMATKPPEIDDFSSPTTVYLRSDIQRDDEAGCWTYVEQQVSAEEYRAARRAQYQ